MTGIQCDGWWGPCDSMNATRQRQRTSYVDDESNWVTLCCGSAWGSPRQQIEPDDLIAKKKIFNDVEALLVEVRKLCKIIVNSPPDTTIKGEIESLAFYIGHHPFVMNGLSKEVENDR